MDVSVTRRLVASISTLALAAGMIPAATAQSVGDPDTAQSVAASGDAVVVAQPDDFMPNYRIPGIDRLEDGTLLAVFDGRPQFGDSPAPNSILMKTSTDDGATWSPVEVIAQGKPNPPSEKHGYSDPSIIVDRETGDIFVFSVYSKDVGFWAGQKGTDDNDRNVHSSAVHVSTDNGKTWETRYITKQVKPDNTLGHFATSGHGIQVTKGPHKGRLVQQMVGRIEDPATGQIRVQAWSVYSDDHGATWKHGTPVGSLMDENKVVELSDGTLMMNSRAHNTYNARWVAYSKDGGETWSEPKLDETLLDPRNNASIINIGGSELLFSNANSTQRENGSVRYSCDDGKTWPVVRSYWTGYHAYSDLVNLGDGSFGSLFEGVDGSIHFKKLDDDWLKPFCAGFTIPDVAVSPGSQATVTATITNDDDATLPAGTATVEKLPHGWEAGTVDIDALAPGESRKVSVPVTAPDQVYQEKIPSELVVRAGDYRLRADITLTNDNPSTYVPTVNITPTVPEIGPLAEGDSIPVAFTVENTGDAMITVVPAEGNGLAPFVPPGPGNCRYRSLAPGKSYTCDTPKYAVTSEDVEKGEIDISTSWEITPIGVPNAKATTVTVDVPTVEIPATAPALAVEYGTPTVMDGFVELPVTIHNKGNVPLTDLTGLVHLDELPAGDSVTTTLRHAITDGTVHIPATSVTGFSGAKRVQAGSDALTIEVTGDTATIVTPEAPKQDKALNIAAIVLGTIGALTGLLALCQQVLNFLHR